MRPASVLVTGASGCLGFPLATRLAADGCAVIGIDIAPPRTLAQFEYVRGDVRNVHLLYRLWREHAFDAVVHCGGISGQMVAPHDPYLNCDVNVFGTVHLLEAARAHGAGRFVYCSSQAAYGAVRDASITESTVFEPTTVYGATKGACDLLLRAYRVQHGLNAVALRIGRVYGPGRRTESVIYTMLDAAIRGEALRLPASGGRRLQYVYDADVVSALYAAVHAQSLPQAAYNISGPGSHTLEEIAEIVRVEVPHADITFDPSRVPTDTYVAAPLDYSAARRDFGYEPEFDVRKGISAYANALRGDVTSAHAKEQQR